MSNTQQTQPMRPYVRQAPPPPGSLQEWMVRALAVRAVQDQADEPATAPIPTPALPADPTPADGPAASTLPSAPAGPAEPTEPEPEPERPAAERPTAVLHRVSVVAAAGGADLAVMLLRVRRTAGTALTRARAASRRTRWIALVGVLAAALAGGIGWQLSDGGTAPTAPQPAVGATAAAGSDPAPAVTSRVKPAAFGQVVKLPGWHVKIAGMKDSPQLKAVPGLTGAAYPRALRMSVTLINTTDRAQLANDWVLSAAVNGTPVQLIIHPSSGYVGVPQQPIQPGGSVVFPIAVALPTSWADLTIHAVNAPAGLVFSVAGKG